MNSTPIQKSILIIDDDVREIRLLSEILRADGYQIFAALSGQDGFQRALAHPPELVLLDLQMPDLDGQATCRLFKGAPQLKRIPIIFLTCSAMLDDKLQAFSHGAVDYITKPFIAPEVLARIRVHLRLSVAHEQDSHGSDQASLGSLMAASDDADKRLLLKAQKFLLSNLGAHLSLHDIAAQVGTNERKLNDEFRRHTGMAVFEYLREQRFIAACELLLHSKQNISAIAAAMGFRSIAAFSYAFRQHCQLTPSQYRQSAGIGAGLPVVDSVVDMGGE